MAILDELLQATGIIKAKATLPDFYEKLLERCSDHEIVDNDTWNALSEPAQEWVNAGIRALRTRREKAKAEAQGKQWAGDPAKLEIVPLAIDDAPEPAPAPEEGAAPADPEPAPKPEPEPASEVTAEPEPAPAPEPEPEPEPQAALETEAAPKKPARGRKKVAKKANKKAAKKAAKKTAKKSAPPKDGDEQAAPATRRSTRRPAAFKKGIGYQFTVFLVQNVKHLSDMDVTGLIAKYQKQYPDAPEVSRATANASMYSTAAVLRVLNELDMYKHPWGASFPNSED